MPHGREYATPPQALGGPWSTVLATAYSVSGHPRAGQLRELFKLAEDSPVRLDAYNDDARVLVATAGGDLVGHLQLCTAPRAANARSRTWQFERVSAPGARRGTSSTRPLPPDLDPQHPFWVACRNARATLSVHQGLTGVDDEQDRSAAH